MTALQELLHSFRQAAVTEREKGTYFEELICTYLRHEATYKDLYSDVWTYAQWAKLQGKDAKDAGIDLVAKTRDTNEYHAIQCKFYAEDYTVKKSDIDSFFTASGTKDFSYRIIVSTTNHWSEHAEVALQNQAIPISKIDLNDLENSQIDWSKYQPQKKEVILKPKKQLRDHQKTALNAVEQGLQTAERGKLIMACGTGKTFTSLKIAEKLAGKGKRVLFLVPSLSLLSQTLTEWTQESETPLHSFAVCSDSDVGKKRTKDDDIVQTFTHELRYPATTDAKRLAEEMLKRHDDDHMSVVFSTYHSINVISDAQNAYQLAEFDLVVCDEAHRTTGATFDGDDESNFVLIHDGEFIHAQKRLYMTATPRIYGENAKASADKDNVTLCSMDNAALFGQELYTINFSEAVKRELLVDYKVIVLAVDESHINARLQSLLKDEDNQLKVDDAAKIVGCWKALSKHGTQEDLIGDTDPMRRAVAFCQVIEPNYKGNTHKVSSKNIAKMFQAVVEAYQEQEADKSSTIDTYLQCQAEHVDGSMNASQKEEKLSWLKEQTPDNTCRILSNVRCLSEGVDVPALDAVLFLTPRNSQVDVVQSVGRVMRLAQGKKRGYVILPVVIPAGVEPHEALNDNKTYKVVWQVLQALRSHDDRFDAMINKMDLDLNAKMLSKMEVIAITDKINQKTKLAKGKTSRQQAGKGSFGIGKKADVSAAEQHELEFEVGEIERAIYAKVVQKCGNRQHWEDWANDIAKIANTHISRIQAILDNPDNTAEIAAFTAFAAELRDDLNNAISNGEIVEMLAQHLITKPVFDALFSDYSFAKFNPMSIAMQDVLDKLHEHQLNKETDTLQRFYDSVQERAKGIDSAAGKQKIVVELYDKFFRNAFPKMTERLGIVYTPVEVVDFIIHSVNDALKNEFGQTLGDKNVHIIDPFTGTGTFITRLLQSGLISDAQLPYKYKNEIHANELVLLAYYIAAINIEAVYHDIILDDYAPFNGICLTDTFQMYEKEDMIDKLLVKNSARRKRQKSLDIRVIIGNPPYSAGQASANDNNANLSYPFLDERIRNTYAMHSTATIKNDLYDSYVRAIRWASDRIKNCGVISFVSNAGWIDSNTGNGLRKCLADEFSSIYVFHLRGNQRTSGELSRKEGGKIFGGGSRAPIAITIFVKNPNATEHGKIYFHDIGDYLSQAQKLEKITELHSINGISAANGWQTIIPDEYNDWLNQRDNSFSEFISLGDKKYKDAVVIFESYSQGPTTSRDAWCYNFSRVILSKNISQMISFFNYERRRYHDFYMGKSEDLRPLIGDFISKDGTKINWSVNLKNSLARNKELKFCRESITHAMYRPFTRQWYYFNRELNHSVSLIPSIFPDMSKDNVAISITGLGISKAFSALMISTIPDYQLQANGQCFPLYLYEANTTPTQTNPQGGLFDEPSTATTTGYTRRDAITNAGLKHFTDYYQEQSITKEDLFYYIYGLLHSIEYKSKYADNLTKELPRIPRVKQLADFWAFSQAGRKLAELHINYETVKPYPLNFDVALDTLSNTDFYVKQMKFAKKGDKSTVIYNSKITIKNIPVAAYDYVVNGKPVLEWVMERQAVTTHKDSGIVNDANDWAIETMNNPRYPLELFLRVINVSLETMLIVNDLPKLEI